MDYELKIHLRNPETFRAPPELLSIHPLGKAPVLEIIPGNGGKKLILAESGHIIQYLIRNYDPYKILTPDSEEQQMQVDYYLHFSEGTMQHINVSLLINSMAKKIAPLGTRTLAGMVTRGLNLGFYIHEFLLNMNFLESQLDKEGTGFFVGSRLSGADIILSFPVWENVFNNPDIHKITGIKKDFNQMWPHLAAWCGNVENHPTYIKVNEIVEEQMEEYLSQENGKR